MVYITSGLFGHDSAYSQLNSSTSTHAHIYNDMVDLQVMAGLGKRKRRADDDKDGPSSKHISISSTELDRLGSGSHTSLSRSSPTREGFIRLHGHNSVAHEASGQRTCSRPLASSNIERRPVKQVKRSNPKLVKTSSHLMDIEVDMSSSLPVQRVDTHLNSDIRSCHACGTAPKRKRDLENYLDCRRCEKRTCYICARKCSGCQREICKECIVEMGRDGDPWCLQCYQRINL